MSYQEKYKTKYLDLEKSLYNKKTHNIKNINFTFIILIDLL